MRGSLFGSLSERFRFYSFRAILVVGLAVLGVNRSAALDSTWPHREYSPSVGNLTDADVLGPDGVVYPDWTNAGVVGGIPEVAGPIFDVASPSGAGDHAAIQAKVTEAGEAGGGVVLLQEGTYQLERTLTILHDNVVLRGQGRDKTRVQFAYTVDRKELKWANPYVDGEVLDGEDLLEIHFSGVDAKSLAFKIDGAQVPSDDWSWTAPAGNHSYSVSRHLALLRSAGLISDGQTHTIEAIMTWQDDTTSSASKTFTYSGNWRGAEGDRRHANQSAAISIAGDTWTGRGGYRWHLYRSAERGDDTVFILHEGSIPLQVGWMVKVYGASGDSWDALVDNTGLPNTTVQQFCEIVEIRDPTVGELVDPVPSGKTVLAVRLSQPLRHRYTIGANDAGGMNARLDASSFPIVGVGIESLTLEQPENLDSADRDDELFADGIRMSMARNCWIRDVRLVSVGRNPISLSGMNLEVRDCRFDGSWWTHVGHGTGYVGFGRLNDALYDNLIGIDLRHAPNAQSGANGNVFRNSVFYGADAQYHLAWAHENLYESVHIDARSFLTALRGDEGVKNGSYGYGIYGQNGHNDIHSPGAGPRNVVYGCDVISSNSGLYLGDATERFILQNSRLRVTGNAPGVILNDYVHDALIQNNAFILDGSAEPLVSFPVDTDTNSISSKQNNSNVGNLGVGMVDNTVYQRGTYGALSSGIGVDVDSGNTWQAWQSQVPMPTTATPSIYAWQLSRPQISVLSPAAWAEGSVGTALSLEVSLAGHNGATLSGYTVRWFVGGEEVAAGLNTQWIPKQVGRHDIRVEVELSDSSIVSGPSVLVNVRERSNELPLASDLIHLHWRADAESVSLDGNGRALTWSDRAIGAKAVRDGQNTFYVNDIPGLAADPETGPLWVESAFGDKPALRFDASNDGLALSDPIELAREFEQGDPRTVFLVLSYSENSEGQIFGTSNNNRISVDKNGGNRVNLRRSSPGDSIWNSSADILSRNEVEDDMPVFGVQTVTVRLASPVQSSNSRFIRLKLLP